MMYRKTKYWHLLLCLLLFSGIRGFSLQGQPVDNDYLHQPLEQKKFKDHQWQQLHKTLHYSGKPPEAEVEAKDTFNSYKPWDFSMPDLSPFLKILAFVLLISLISLLAYHIITNRNNDKILSANNADSPDESDVLLSHEQLAQQLDRQEVHPYILKAEQQHNYPLAVRFHFLALLKNLHENKQIYWKKNYTNNTYLQQMKEKNHYTDFQQLTREYERIWYGDRHPTEREYELIRKDFNDLHTVIESTDKP